MEEKEILQRAREEIRSLRKRNELLEARMSGIDDALALLYGKPGAKTEGAMSPDVAFEIDKRLTKLNQPQAAP